MGRTFLIGLLVFLSAATVQAQSGYFTDPHGHITATFQGTDSGYSYWSDAHGLPLGTLYQAPSLLRASPAPLDLGVGGGFGQGFVQGYQGAQDRALRWGAFALQRDAVDAQIRLMETETQIRQLELQRLQAQEATRQWQTDALVARLLRLPAPRPTPPLSDEQVEDWARRQATQDVLRQAATAGSQDAAEALALLMAVDEGLFDPDRRRGVACPTQTDKRIWLDDHHTRWGSTPADALLAYMRSGYVDCP